MTKIGIINNTINGTDVAFNDSNSANMSFLKLQIALILPGSVQDPVQIGVDKICNGNKECRLGSVQRCMTMKPTSCPQ